MLDSNQISAILHFGYLPRAHVDTTDISWLEGIARFRNTPDGSHSESELVANGIDALKYCFRDIPPARHIVPISGGLDSRAILAGLLDAGLRDHITGVVFGVPGNLDYEIGNLVAKVCGIDRVSIDLNDVELNTESLVDAIAGEGHIGWAFDFYYNRLIPKQFGSDAVYWSGFMGDSLSGAHMWSVEKPTWEEGVAAFIEHNRLEAKLSHPEFDPMSVLPNHPPMKDTPLGFDEQLDFAVRQASYIQNTVLVPRYDYRTPFLDDCWVKFMLSVPRTLRYEQRLYRKILLQAFPEQFALPTKTNLGLPLNCSKWNLLQKRASRKIGSVVRRRTNKVRNQFGMSISPEVRHVNYIDFDESIRQRKDLKELVSQNLSDLAQRNIIDWIDVEDIWAEHQKRVINYGYPISMLVSIEVILKSRDQR